MKYKVYGPYVRTDGRQHVILCFDDGSLKTISYPKFLIEQYLGIKLEINDTVHHKNGDFTDNRFENLEVLDRVKHVKLDVKRIKRYNTICVWCGKGIKLTKDQIKDKQVASPFCSRKCVGEYGAEVQNGRCDKLPTKDIKTVYYRNSDK